MEDCIEWKRGKSGNGYGMVWVPELKQNVGAHRVAWEQSFGPIPEGMVVMHLCDNKACINVLHLALGSQKDNMRDMAEKRRHANSVKECCPAGHPYEGDNILWKRTPTGLGRNCRICYRESNRRYAKRKKADKNGGQ
jgi:hypothetical protein